MMMMHLILNVNAFYFFQQKISFYLTTIDLKFPSFISFRIYKQ